MSKTRIVTMFVYSLAAILIGVVGARGGSAISTACAGHHCWCMPTGGMGQSGFGGGRGNTGIQIKYINPHVTGIKVTNKYKGKTYFAGMPFVGQFIPVDAHMTTEAFAPGLGLTCALAYWIIDYRGIPQH